MIPKEKNTIPADSTVLESLVRLNELSDSGTLTLFATDSDLRVSGTVTDGDIRRALIRGRSLETPVSEVMNRNFTALREGNFDTATLKAIREKGLKLVPVLDGADRLVRVLDYHNRKAFLPLDAVLMAGGRGERLRPLTLGTPKPLLPIGDRTIIDRNVDNLMAYGIEHISVTVNYLKEQIESHFAAPRNGVQVRCVAEPRFLGTMGSARLAEKGPNDAVLVMNSDLFTNIDFEEFYFHFMDHEADMSVAAVPYPVSVPYGIFDLEGRNIRGIREKPTYNYYANGGIYLLKRELLDAIPEGERYHATDLMEQLIAEGRRVIRFPLTGYWIDIGKPEDYRRACEMAKHL